MTKYVRAAGGDWNQAATWSSSSGGSADTTVPTLADDCVQDAASGALAIVGSPQCRSFYAEFATAAITHGSVQWSFGDGTAGTGNVALRLGASQTYTPSGAPQFVFRQAPTGMPQSVHFADKNLGAATLTFGNIAAGNWRFDSGYTSTAALTHTAGTLDFNGQTFIISSLVSTGSAARTTTMGAASLTVVSASAGINFTGSNHTFNADTSTITMTGGGPTLAGNGKTFATVSVTGNNLLLVTGANTFGNFSRTGGSATGLSLAADQTITGTFTCTGGSATSRILVQSNTVGTARTITAAAVSLQDCDFQDITGAGAATWSGTRIGNALGNAGITFTPAVTRWWVGGAGNISDSAHWSASDGGAGGASIPLPQDTVRLNANSGGGTVVFDLPRIGAELDTTGFTGTPSLSTATVLYGNVTWGASLTAVTASANNRDFRLAGRGSHTITSNGVTTAGWVHIIAAVTGTYTLADAFASGSASGFACASGTFNDAGFNITLTIGNFTVNSGAIATLTGTISLSRLTGTPVNIATGASLTAAAATFVFSSASSSDRTFTGGGKFFGVLDYTVADSPGKLILTGSNTFGELRCGDDRTLEFTAGTTTTVGDFDDVRGTAGKLVVLQSSSAGSPFTLVKSGGGIVDTDYLSIKDSAASPADTWFAGSHSTNVSGVTGWIFTDVVAAAATPASAAWSADAATASSTFVAIASPPSAEWSVQAGTSTPGTADVVAVAASASWAVSAVMATPGHVDVDAAPAAAAWASPAATALSTFTATAAAASAAWAVQGASSVPGQVTVGAAAPSASWGAPAASASSTFAASASPAAAAWGSTTATALSIFVSDALAAESTWGTAAAVAASVFPAVAAPPMSAWSVPGGAAVPGQVPVLAAAAAAAWMSAGAFSQREPTMVSAVNVRARTATVTSTSRSAIVAGAARMPSVEQ